ncbi:hypothetical protein K470DRAFT_214360, partial [Piedraia hortae CBS 480.64]
ERAKAKELFGTFDAPTELAQSIIAVRSNNPLQAAQPIDTGSKKQKLKLSETEKKRFEDLLRKASSMSEIERLEKMINEGRLPPGVADNEMDET